MIVSPSQIQAMYLQPNYMWTYKYSLVRTLYKGINILIGKKQQLNVIFCLYC